MTDNLFSVIVALYNVERYFDTFMTSLLKQSYPFEKLDIIIVDDGSTDGSLGLVRNWSEKHSNVQFVSKENGGPASARNIGIDLANNPWVTFCDPDDALEAGYFSHISDFIERDVNATAAMLTTRVMIWQEKTGAITDTHPLGRKFFYGDRLVDLNQEPNNIQLGGATVFLRRDILNEHNFRFDPSIRPTFEDGHLIGRYLGCFEKPIVGIVSKARYFYRKRGDGSSLVQSGWGQVGRYDHVLRYGYLGLLDELLRHHGSVPVWAQNMVLYDIQWYLTEDKKMNSATAWLDADQLLTFHELLQTVFRYISRESIDLFNVVPLSWITREAMLVRFKGQGFRTTRIFRWSEPSAPVVELVYCFSGRLPSEKFLSRGDVINVLRSKSVDHTYFGEVFFTERRVWLAGPNENVQAILDGDFARFESPRRPGWAKPKSTGGLTKSVGKTAGTERRTPIAGLPWSSKFPNPSSQVEQIVRKLDSRMRVEQLISSSSRPLALLNIAKRVSGRVRGRAAQTVNKAYDQRTRAWALSDVNRTKYKNAWSVMDRPMQADDNGEHFYRYLKQHQPNVNTWFMLDRKSPDWERLALEGFKLIPYGSREAVALSLNAAFQISSDATGGVQFPVGKERFGVPKAKFIFLQHGVIKDDLSRWLNPKEISMFVTSTRAEYNSIAGDGTPYRFTPKETKLTGLPRFDNLIKVAGSVPLSDRNVILVMPTWRQDLRDKLSLAKTSVAKAKIFEGSDYGREWLAFLRSERLKTVADASSSRIIFVTHPAMTGYLHHVNLPTHVETLDQGSASLQELLSKASCVVTDYSSIAFDAAIIFRPVLYFQFDHLTIFNGSHSYRRGYYDYARDGFGPVVHSLAELNENLFQLSVRQFENASLYTSRINETFENIDTNNSRRVFEEVVRLGI